MTDGEGSARGELKPAPMSPEGEAALAEWKRLIDAGDTDVVVRTAARHLTDIVAPTVDRISDEIDTPALDVTLVCRCVVKRAFDAALAIQALTSTQWSYNALALLRPVCEDYFFVSLLLGLPREVANRYIVEKARLEIEEGLLAQEDFFPRMRERFGRAGMLSRTRSAATLRAAIDLQRGVVKDLGGQLGWGQTVAPRVKYMAEQADALPEYDFLYRGASSSVHASLHHLLRMVWGDPDGGVFSVSNSVTDQYYARFALIYGGWLMDAVMDAAAGELPELNEPRDSEAYGIWLATLLVPAIEHGAPGLVTRQELEWSGPRLDGA